MHTIAYILAAVAVVGALLSTIAATPIMQAQNQTEGNQTGNETTGPIATGNETVPQPPEPEPEPVTNETQVPPPTNATEEPPVPTPAPKVLTQPGGEGPFNITAVQEPEEATITVTLASLTDGGNNVTVIEPNGNITEIPDVNVTQVDNDTLVIAPPTENVTTIPETNVTIITPAPEECLCPEANETAEEEPLAPVIVRPAPGQQVTIEGGEVTVENETGVVVEGGSDNATESAGGGNETGVAPVSAFEQALPWLTRT